MHKSLPENSNPVVVERPRCKHCVMPIYWKVDYKGWFHDNKHGKCFGMTTWAKPASTIRYIYKDE